MLFHFVICVFCCIVELASEQGHQRVATYTLPVEAFVTKVNIFIRQKMHVATSSPSKALRHFILQWLK